jgi:hypothetical protein
MSNHHIKPKHPPKCASSYLKWPHQPLIATTIIKELFANLQPHMHVLKPMIVGHTSCDLITRKGNELNIPHQIPCFVRNNLMHIGYNLPTSVIKLMHFGIIFDIKEPQLVHVLIINHGSTFKQQMKTNKKLD